LLLKSKVELRFLAALLNTLLSHIKAELMWLPVALRGLLLEELVAVWPLIVGLLLLRGLTDQGLATLSIFARVD